MLWILDFLPDSIFVLITYALFGMGAALYVFSKLASWIPMFMAWRFPLELVGVAVLVAGSYFMGGAHNQARWIEKVRELEARLREAEAQSQQANVVIQERVVTKIKTIKEIEYVNREIIREVAGQQLDNLCQLPVSSVVLHDSASQGQVAGGAASTDGTPSTVKASELLDVVVQNYGACNENAAKLEAWQEWYRTQKDIFESAQK